LQTQVYNDNQCVSLTYHNYLKQLKQACTSCL